MRRLVPISALAALMQLAPGGAEVSVVELPISFEIVNQNRSVTAQLCQGDGKTYTVRGSLVGPAGVEAGRIGSVPCITPGVETPRRGTSRPCRGSITSPRWPGSDTPRCSSIPWDTG